MDEYIKIIKLVADIIYRRRFIIIISLCVSIIFGIYTTQSMPKIYMAKTLIIIDPQKVPSNFVKAIVSNDVNVRVSTISKEILSIDNIEKIIKKFKLFSNVEMDDMYHEDKLDAIRKRIDISFVKVSRGSNALSISYKSKNPQIAADIVNYLASMFINENMKQREAQAMGTSRFLIEELKVKKAKLEMVEQAVKNYRKQYMGELPEQLNSNMRILDRLQLQLSEQYKNMAAAKSRRLQIKNSMGLRGHGIDADIQTVEGEEVVLLDNLKNILARFEEKYTDKHPNVVITKSKIKALEKRLSSRSLTPKTTPAIMSPPSNTELSMADQEIQALEHDIAEINKKIKYYNDRIDNTGKRELELISMKRDYQNIQSSYNSLLNRKLEAELSVNMEKKQKGERFRILDKARVPEKPYSPNLQKVFMVTIFIGLVCGGLISFLLEIFDTSFKRPEDMETTLDLPIIGKIPQTATVQNGIVPSLNMAVTVSSIFITTMLLAGFAMLSFQRGGRIVKILESVISYSL